MMIRVDHGGGGIRGPAAPASRPGGKGAPATPQWNTAQEEVHWLQHHNPLSLQWLQCPY